VDRDASTSSPFTPKTLLAGTLLCLLISFATPYTGMYLLGSLMATDFGTAAALFLLFLFIGLNILLHRLHPRLVFRRHELAVIYAMMITACSIPTMGLMEYVLPGLTALSYYTTPENNWQELIQPYVKPWLVVEDPLASKFFYEGLPQGMAIPWEAWVRPLCAWAVFVLALYLVMICVAVLIRRQWMDHERLLYPLVQVPMALIQQDERAIPPFFKSALLWTGFSLGLIVGSLKGLHHYHSAVPQIAMTTSLSIFRDAISLPIMLSFAVVGLAYFISLDIALGIWFFSMLATLEKGLFSIVGIQSAEMVSVYGTPESPFLAHQGIGAMLVFVFVGLWTARNHLGAIWRQAWHRDAGLDDDGEMLSYRGAVIGLLSGLAVMSIWLWLSGLPALLVVLFLVVALAIFFALTRIVVEGGVAAARSPMIASTFVVSGVGTSLVGMQGLVALAFTYIWHGDVRTFVMASCADGLKMVEGVRSLRPLFWLLILAIVVTMVGSGITILYLAYTYGGINLHGWFFDAGPQVPFHFIANKMQNTPPMQLEGWLFKGIGGSIMAALMLLRHRFLWWPFHPLGFAICTVSFIVGRIWFSVFLAWLLKILILKYGGATLHRKMVPLFMGMVLGQVCNAGFWLIIDTFTGTSGNGIGALFW
jgi:hypothetical protein